MFSSGVLPLLMTRADVFGKKREDGVLREEQISTIKLLAVFGACFSIMVVSCKPHTWHPPHYSTRKPALKSG